MSIVVVRVLMFIYSEDEHWLQRRVLPMNSVQRMQRVYHVHMDSISLLSPNFSLQSALAQLCSSVCEQVQVPKAALSNNILGLTTLA